MSPGQMRASCAKYADRLRVLGSSPVRASPDVRLERSAMFDHAAWMCEEVVRLLDTGYVDRAKRWFGFVQGAMWALSVYSISDFKNDTVTLSWDGKGDADGHGQGQRG